MEKLKKFIVNLKVAGKLKAYRLTVLTMTVLLVAVALISTLVIRSNVRSITKVWFPAIGYIQELETLTTEYRVKQYQHLVESDAAVMTACEEELESIATQITENSKALAEIINSHSDARKGQADYDKANTAWDDYKSFTEEIIRLSTAGKQAEASEIMVGGAYEKYTSFRDLFSTLHSEFQVELDSSKQSANVCTVIIFIVIIVAGIAIAVATTFIGKVITDSITEPVAQIEAAVASLRKGELSNVDMLTYESEDEFGDTVRNLKEAMNILSDYVREISEEVKFIAQGDLTRNGNDITDFLGDFSELKHSLLFILKRFNSTLSEITDISKKVSSNAQDVENASKSLADGATEQAGVIEELNATIDTVVNLAADTAKETKSASERVKASANKANEEKENMTPDQFRVYMSLKDDGAKEQFKREYFKIKMFQIRWLHMLPKEWISRIPVSSLIITIDLPDTTTNKYKKINEYYTRCGKFPKPIIVDKNNFVLDGFTVVLYARNNRIKEIPAIVLENVEVIF